MSGWFDLAVPHGCVDFGYCDVAFALHGDGLLAYRISQYEPGEPIYCGFGRTYDEAIEDYNAGLEAMKVSEWYGTKHG